MPRPNSLAALWVLPVHPPDHLSVCPAQASKTKTKLVWTVKVPFGRSNQCAIFSVQKVKDQGQVTGYPKPPENDTYLAKCWLTARLQALTHVLLGTVQWTAAYKSEHGVATSLLVFTVVITIALYKKTLMTYNSCCGSRWRGRWGGDTVWWIWVQVGCRRVRT